MNEPKFEVILKIISLFGVLYLVPLFFFFRSLLPAKTTTTKTGNELTFEAPLISKVDLNFGFLQEPRVSLPLKSRNGYMETQFLIDSGAVVSTLPMKSAKDLGLNLEKARRITLQGFAGMPAFAYVDTITVKIGDKDYSFPATFSEANTSQYILGRKGLFDDFTITFDPENKVMTLKQI